eukprot:gene12384-15650_t
MITRQTQKVKDMTNMFTLAESFVQDISGWPEPDLTDGFDQGNQGRKHDSMLRFKQRKNLKECGNFGGC